MNQLIFASLFHTHYWYEVGMFKAPYNIGEKLTVMLYKPHIVKALGKRKYPHIPVFHQFM